MSGKKDELIFDTIVEEGGIYDFNVNTDNIRFIVEWTSKTYGSIVDLDLNIICYDERSRFIEKLDGTHKNAKDHSITLLSDLEPVNPNTYVECMKANFDKVKPQCAAILVSVTGGPRNFQNVANLSAKCVKLAAEKESNFLPSGASNSTEALFISSTKPKRDYQGIAICVLYKDGWQRVDTVTSPEVVDESNHHDEHDHEKPIWHCKCVMEPLYGTTSNANEEQCAIVVIKSVPSLDKFRPRLFSTVKDVCAALSSLALPKLKKKFQKTDDGLHLGEFTEVLFMQLYDSHPKIADETEAAYTVAMIQEMFGQIDFNGDGNCDWDEFTNFCIQTGVEATAHASANSDSLDEYIIEYGEDMLLRDKFLSNFRFASLMQYIPVLKKFMMVVEDSNVVNITDDKFRPISKINPTKIQIQGELQSREEVGAAMSNLKLIIYDVIYLEGRDLFALTCSDHSITVCKEQQSAVTGSRNNYIQHNKIFHNVLQLKLCWSKKAEILCSVSSDKSILGWDIDKDNTQPLFQVSRHSDIVTDFISVDCMDIFVTCSMDKRIVMWSHASRRVKGILLGHKRGVRCLSAHETLLLSAGFETDAKTWDLLSRDHVATLRGHRKPIVQAKLMTNRAKSEKEYRAVTVDECGEFRLWSVYVKERTSSAAILPSLQIFEMHHPEPPLDNIRFLAIPGHPQYSTSYYSDIVAIGSKFLRFLPEKNAKEYIPPACSIYNDDASSIITGVGKSLVKYDVTKGTFLTSFSDINTAEITALCLEGDRGRKLYVGYGNGDFTLVNYTSGQVLISMKVHQNEITCITRCSGRRNNIYTSSLDGRIRILEEIDGDISMQSSIDFPFGEGIGIASVTPVPSLRALLLSSVGKGWGLWSDVTFRRLISINEDSLVQSIALVGASRDEEDYDYMKANSIDPDDKIRSKELLVTVAIAIKDCVKIYTLDLFELRGVVTFELYPRDPIYINELSILRTPGGGDFVNYTSSKNRSSLVIGIQIIAISDEGIVSLWDANNIRQISEAKYRKTFSGAKSRQRITPASPMASQKGSPPSSSPVESPKASSKTISRPGTPGKGLFLTGVDELKEGKQDEFVISNVTEFSCRNMLTPKEGLIKVITRNQWRCHYDTISAVLPMHDHGCFMTISYDGYQRIWNIDKDCLGELPLPNITEKMKNPRQKIADLDSWKFILERIPVTEAQKAIAHILVQKLAADKNETKRLMKEERDRRKNVFKKQEEEVAMAQLIESTSMCSLEEAEKIALRTAVIKSLSEPPVLNYDGPPTLLELASLKDATRRSMDGGPMERIAELVRTNISSSNSVSSSSVTSATSRSMSLNQMQSLSLMRSSMVKSLWSTADDLGMSDTRKSEPVPAAFTEDSINKSMNDGLIDDEGHAILRKIMKAPDKGAQYDQAVPVILLRNPAMSATIRVPPIDSIKKSEINFGQQKDMYKNADKILGDKDGLSTKLIIRHSVTLARIDQNVRRIKNMVHIVNPSSHADVVVPNSEQNKHQQGLDKWRSEEQKMRLRLMQSAALVPPEARMNERPLDKGMVETLMLKIKTATETGTDFEMRMKAIMDKKMAARKKEILSPQAVAAIEKKLCLALRDFYRVITGKPIQNVNLREASVLKKELTTRALLPFYKVQDVKHFLDIFAKNDEDFSGDLDLKEWVNLFTSLNKNIPPQEARMIFMKVDKDNNGSVSLRELIPVIFSKAKKSQLKLITEFAESEMIRKVEGITTVTISEIDNLFEAYDTQNVGFVEVGYLKERIRSFPISENAIFTFMENLVGVEDDEMFNQVEFARLFKSYIGD